MSRKGKNQSFTSFHGIKFENQPWPSLDPPPLRTIKGRSRRCAFADDTFSVTHIRRRRNDTISYRFVGYQTTFPSCARQGRGPGPFAIFRSGNGRLVAAGRSARGVPTRPAAVPPTRARARVTRSAAAAARDEICVCRAARSEYYVGAPRECRVDEIVYTARALPRLCGRQSDAAARTATFAVSVCVCVCR